MIKSNPKCPACKQPLKLAKNGKSKKISQIMKKYKISQTALSKILGVSQATISWWIQKEINVKPIYFEKLKKKGYA